MEFSQEVNALYEQQLVDAIDVLCKEILVQQRQGKNFDPLVFELERLLEELGIYRKQLSHRESAF